VPTVLHVIDDLGYRGPARQLLLLAGGQAGAGWAVRVVVLGAATPWAEELRRGGVAVDTLNRTRPFDLWPFLALRRLLRTTAADVVHAWGPLSLRALTTVARPSARLVAAAVLPPAGPPGWVDRRLLRRAAGVLAFGPAEAERYQRLGYLADRTAVVRPAVAPPSRTADEPTDGRVVLGVGPLERHKGFHDAVWALDILHYLYDDLKLVLAGDGGDRARLADFADHLGVGGRMTFAGVRADPGPLYDGAALVWVPGRGGVNVALEALAAGRAVVAARVPELAEVVEDGVSGVLFPAGDKPSLARATRELLDDPQRRRRMAEAGRRRVRAFGVGQLTEGCLRLYGA